MEETNTDFLPICSDCETKFEPSEELKKFFLNSEYRGHLFVVGNNLVTIKEVDLHCKNCTDNYVKEYKNVYPPISKLIVDNPNGE